MSQNSDEYDVHYELWRRGRGEANPDDVYYYLDRGYEPGDVADIICDQRDRLKSECQEEELWDLKKQ